MIEIVLGLILFVVGLVWIVVRGIIEVLEQQKAIQFSASLIGKDKKGEDKEYIFVNDDESEELNAMMAETDEEEEEFFW